MAQLKTRNPQRVVAYTFTTALCLFAAVGVCWISFAFLAAAFSSFADSPPARAGGLTQLLIGSAPGLIAVVTYRGGKAKGLGALARASRTAVFSFFAALFLFVGSFMVTAGVILWR